MFHQRGIYDHIENEEIKKNFWDELLPIKNVSKPLFHLIRSSTKIIEFDNIKFPKNMSSKDGVWREFPEIDSNGASSKNEYFKKVNFLLLFFSE